jgi:hypothetical protein
MEVTRRRLPWLTGSEPRVTMRLERSAPRFAVFSGKGVRKAPSAACRRRYVNFVPPGGTPLLILWEDQDYLVAKRAAKQARAAAGETGKVRAVNTDLAAEAEADHRPGDFDFSSRCRPGVRCILC